MAKRNKMPPKSKLLRIVNQFNREHPVGSPVRLRKDTGWVDSFVTAPATLLGGHNAVAFFEGVRGAYSIGDGRVTGRDLNDG